MRGGVGRDFALFHQVLQCLGDAIEAGAVAQEAGTETSQALFGLRDRVRIAIQSHHDGLGEFLEESFRVATRAEGSVNDDRLFRRQRRADPTSDQLHHSIPHDGYVAVCAHVVLLS